MSTTTTTTTTTVTGKRVLSSSSSSSSSASSGDDGEELEVFRVAPVSQAGVPGAEQACTAIATLACAAFILLLHQDLFSPAFMEHLIRQGGELHRCWQQYANAKHWAHGKQLVDFVSRALPVCSGDEYGGCIWRNDEADEANFTLPEALADIADSAAGTTSPVAAVLTCQGLSLAVMFLPGGAMMLFDSHPVADMDNKAACFRFDHRDDLTAFLRQRRFPDEGTDYSICVVRKRLSRSPDYFPIQDPAFAAADVFPKGMLRVWARDSFGRNEGAKEYLVASEADFCAYYEAKGPKERSYYDMAREAESVTFFADLEFDVYARKNAGKDHHAMLRAFLDLVIEQWAAETDIRLDHESLTVCDSSTAVVEVVEDADDDVESMSISDKEEEEEEGEPVAKVSFHVHNQRMRFANSDVLGAFMRRVEQRGAGDESLQVWRSTWVPKDKAHVWTLQFFADQSVYSANRLMRLAFSTKRGHARPFVPYPGGSNERVDWSVVERTLVCPPFFQPREAFVMQAATNAPSRQTSMRQHFGSSTSSKGNKLIPLHTIPEDMAGLVEVMRQHYQPEQIRGVTFEPTGLVTVSMVKHDCEICHDTHNNQVYAVADLKRRVFYQKCHVDRSKFGQHVPFPPLATTSMIKPEEMTPEGDAFPATSSSARVILSVAHALFSGGRTVPQLPSPGEVVVLFNTDRQQYRVRLTTRCAHDDCHLELRVHRDKLCIACPGKNCTQQGKRWERPSRSVGEWNLDFLFPPLPPLPELPAVGGQDQDATARFLAEPNFLRLVPGPRTSYKAALMALERQLPKTDEVQQKLSVMKAILLDPLFLALYRECLAVAPDFVYPMLLIPQDPPTLVTALWMHVTRTRGYKRNDDDYYVPTTDEAGRKCYRVVPLLELPTLLCTFDLAPNLCSSVLWKGRQSEDLFRMLRDQNHFPSQPISKRYLGFFNAVYDLEENRALTWEEVAHDSAVIPFNFIKRDFPVALLEAAQKHCPQARIVTQEDGKRTVVFDGSDESFGGSVPTPLFDGALRDQNYTADIILWLYALLGRVFHDAGKGPGGDNWEIALFLIGAPGTFKSSVVTILQWFFQHQQMGIIATRVEERFPISSLAGKLAVFMTECGGCTLERDLFKLMASGDPVKINTKFSKGVDIPNWLIPLVFCGNSFLAMLDTDGAVERRCAIFVFLYLLRSGQSESDLVKRILEQESISLLIKWNTLYCHMRRTIRERVHDLLPPSVRQATQELVTQKDSLRLFLATECVLERGARAQWHTLWTHYITWCKSNGKKPYSADLTDIEVQTMLARMGVRQSQRRGPATLVGIRKRTAADMPHKPSVKVAYSRRRQRRGNGQKDAEGNGDQHDDDDDNDDDCGEASSQAED